MTLKSSKDFERLFREGRRLNFDTWLTVNFKKNDHGQLRCGWTISRGVGNAVLRNRFRRWCREYFRTEGMDFHNLGVDLNVVLRKKEKGFYKNVGRERVYANLQKALKFIGKDSANLSKNG